MLGPQRRTEGVVYGTIGRMKAKTGKREDLVALMNAAPTGAAAQGYRGSYLLKADEGDEVVVVVMYEDKDAYFAMVHDPATDENFGKVMELVEGEPTWTDGEWFVPA
jgi:heme-degrading monooxygenase HmoA